MDSLFFNSTDALLRTVVVGALAYVALIVMLRLSGKRTLAKWNAFDLVVTVAFGSTLASALTSQSVALAQAVLALALLVLLQFSITFLSVRSNLVTRAVKARPTLLLFRGEFVREALDRERVTEGEVRAAVRSAGHADLGQVDAVVLETTGDVSVIAEIDPDAASAVLDVEGLAERLGLRDH